MTTKASKHARIVLTKRSRLYEFVFTDRRLRRKKLSVNAAAEVIRDFVEIMFGPDEKKA